MDIDNLSVEEIIFFEDSLKKAVELAEKHFGDDMNLATVIVDDHHEEHITAATGGRGLRGSDAENRTLWTKWFDIWAYIEF